MSLKTWRTINVELSTTGIDRAIREIEACKEQIVTALNELIIKLTEEGANIAKMQVASMDAVDTGELEHSIYGYFDTESRIGYIIAGAPHAFYVEYGTGPVGAANPHPDPGRAAWEYDIGPHIHDGPGGRGWWYDASGDNVLSGNGKYAWTHGQPSRPFMYNTLVWLEEAAEALGRNVMS